MHKLLLSLFHVLIITGVSLAILFGVAYATVLNEQFWLTNIARNTLVPTPTATNSPAVATETNISAIIFKALSQEALQAEMTSLTKATFMWLRGDSSQLEYRPNLEAFKPQIIASLREQYLQQLQEGSIACPPSGIITDEKTGVTIPCNAAQDPAALAEIYAQSITNSAIQDASAQNTQRQPDASNMSFPRLYQAGAIATWVLPIATLALIGVAILVASERMRQLSYIARHICLALLPNLLLIGGGLLLLSISLQLSPQAIADLQQYGLGGLLRAVMRESAITYLVTTLAVMIAAGVVWLVARQLAHHDVERDASPSSAAQSSHDTL